MPHVLKMTGSKAEVRLSVVLPKTATLPSVTFEDSYVVNLDVGDIKKNPEAKEILKKFEHVYNLDMKITANRLEREMLSKWADIGKLADKVKTQKDKDDLMAAFAKSVEDPWKRFIKEQAVPMGNRVLGSLIKALKSDGVTLASKPKLAIGDATLKSARIDVLVGVLKGLGLVAAGAATGGLGWLAVGLGGLEALFKGFDGFSTVARKRSGELQTNLEETRKGIEAADKVLADLAPALGRIGEFKKIFGVEMAEAAHDIGKLRSDVATFEARAGKEGHDKEKAVLKVILGRAESLQERIKGLEGQIAEISKLEEVVAVARKATEQARRLVTKEQKSQTALEGELAGLLKDKTTLASALKEVAKAVSKAI